VVLKWFLLVGKRIVAYLAAHRLWAAFFFKLSGFHHKAFTIPDLIGFLSLFPLASLGFAWLRLAAGK
jgi:hypothetical protein